MMAFKSRALASYNDRLFSGGFRGKLHRGRYEWVHRMIERQGCPCTTVLELGCFDGKAINWLPSRPERYLGLDANWENGLDIATELWRDNQNYEFRYCDTPEKMALGNEKFDVSLCLETLEHVPTDLVDPYLANLARATRHIALISVPNEIGLVFLFKYLFKTAVGEATSYTAGEILNETLGRVERVRRNEHKEFSWRVFRQVVSAHFDILSVEGMPFRSMPSSLNFGVGFLARPKATSSQMCGG